TVSGISIALMVESPPIIFVSYDSCTGSLSCIADIREYVRPVDSLSFSETSNCVNIPAATLGLSVVNDELTSTPNFHLPDVVPCCSCRSMDVIVDSFQPDEAVSSSVLAGETREGRV